MKENLDKFYKLNEELLKNVAEITTLSAKIANEEDEPITATLTTVWLKATLNHLVYSIDTMIEQTNQERADIERLASIVSTFKRAEDEQEARELAEEGQLQ